jgi:hypothetical protein
VGYAVNLLPRERKPHTSRRSSSFLNTRSGSSASATRSSYSFAESWTGLPASLTTREARSISRSHPREELVVDEGFHDVVVAAARESPHAVDRIPAGADHDHGDVAVPAPARLAVTQAAAELEAGDVEKVGLEQDARPDLAMLELEE